MSDRPLVSIGLPVYNGEAYVEEALRALLTQDYRNLELVVCDNASTDGTESVCRRLAEEYPQIVYTRNATNLGAMPNFGKAVERATGEYFMWAACDDLWSSNYVSALVTALEASPTAVLATPRTSHVRPDGSPTHHDDDRPAPGRSRLDNLRVFYADNAASWIYGLYRSEWIKVHFAEWFAEDYPTWGGDVMWMVSVVLRYPIVGDAEARFMKRLLVNSCEPKTEAEKLRFALVMLTELTRICRRYGEGPLGRAWALLLSWHYTYRRYIRRGNPLKTLWRLVRLPAAAAALRAERKRHRAASLAAGPTA